jgi:hypothetical protein
VTGRYSNRSDLLERLRKVAAILSGDGQEDDMGAEIVPRSVISFRRLRDRFSAEDLQMMIDLYRSGTTARRVDSGVELCYRSRGTLPSLASRIAAALMFGP